MEEFSSGEESAADGVPVAGRRTQSSARTGPAADGRAENFTRTGAAGDEGPAARRRRILDPKHVRIVEAFVDLAAEHGFAGATAVRVCERTGMSRRTFYECFTDREDCFGAVLEEGKETAIEIVAEAFDREEHPGGGLRAVCRVIQQRLRDLCRAPRRGFGQTPPGGLPRGDRHPPNASAWAF